MRCGICELCCRRRIVMVTVAAAVLASGWVLWKQLHKPVPPTANPPEIPTSVHDKEIVAALERARNSVISNPNSGLAWGELGLVFLAHRFHRESDICFVEASRFDPTNPRWPYLIGLHN